MLARFSILYSSNCSSKTSFYTQFISDLPFSMTFSYFFCPYYFRRGFLYCFHVSVSIKSTSEMPLCENKKSSLSLLSSKRRDLRFPPAFLYVWYQIANVWLPLRETKKGKTMYRKEEQYWCKSKVVEKGCT